MGPEWEHVHVDSTPGRQWAAKSEQGSRNRSVLRPTGSLPGEMTSLHVATSTVTHVDTIEAASTPEPKWLWCGGIELSIGAQE